MSSEDIIYITSENVDRLKWDHCIMNSLNKVIYAYSWYLDIVTNNWDALVFNDYSIVFPLTYRKKFGIYYLYQPPFTQQLGIFSQNVLNENTIITFLHKIPSKFRLTEINLNLGNQLKAENIQCFQKVTYLLNLRNNYENLRNKYSQNTLRNIKKAEKKNIFIKIGNENSSQLVDFFIKTTLVYDKNFSPATKTLVHNLVSLLVKKESGVFYSACDENNKICCCAFFVTHQNKSIYLFASANDYAKKYGVMHKLIDTFIQLNANTNVNLDFEGSMDTGVARFYESFGAEKNHYLHIKKNNFPLILRWIKK